MQQLSRPYRIALVALAVLAAAWFTVLKPSEPEAAPLPGAGPAKLPGQRGLATAVAKAKGAAETSTTASGAAGEDVAPGAAPAAAPTAGAAAEPRTSRAGRGGGGRDGRPGAPGANRSSADAAAPILRDVAHGRVAVLLFYSPRSVDDQAVRRALRHADRRGGRVTFRVVPIARVARYATITAGVQVLQSPTILVIGTDRRARVLVGYVDTRSVDQLVADVGGPSLGVRRAKR